MGPSIGSDLENSEPKILEDFDEEGIQREPHSESEVALRQSDITNQRSMQSLRIIRLDHIEAILLRYPCPIFQNDQRLEVATVDSYFLCVFLALAARSGLCLLCRLHSSAGHRMRDDLRRIFRGRSAGLRDLPRQGVT